MLKTFLTSIVLALASQITYAQPKYNSSTTVSFDLLNPAGPFPEDFYIKDKVRIRYRISNINRSVYNITFNSEAKSQFAEKPPIFSILTDIDLTKLTPPAPSGSEGFVIPSTPFEQLSTGSNPSEQALIDRYVRLKGEIKSLIEGLYNSNQKLKRLNIYYRNLTSLLNDGTTPFNNLYNTKLSSTNSILTADFSYGGSATDDATMRIALRSGTDNLLLDMDQNYQKLLQQHAQLKVTLGAIEQLAPNVLKKLNAKKKGEKDRTKKEAIQTAIDNVPIEVIIEKLATEGYNEIMAEIKAVNAKVLELQQNGFAQTIATTHQKINGDNWEYISPSVKGQEDLITVKMTIEPKESTIFSSNYSQFNGEYTGSVYGFKVNFSTGLFLLLGKELFDRSYRLDSKDTDNNTIVENEVNQAVQPAVGALMHFYVRQPGFFSWGGNLGFSVSSQTRLNYHGGLSFILGEDKRIILSGGATLTQVKRLGNAYQVGQTIPKSTELNPIPTENNYRGGGFLALTYNLSK